MKTIVLITYFFFLMLFSIPIWIFVKITNNQYVLFKFEKFSGRSLNLLAGNKVEVIGRENIPNETFLMVANHEGFFDIPNTLEGVNRVVAYVSKKEFKKTIMFAAWNKRVGSVFLDRQDPRQGLRDMKQVQKNLENGRDFVIFPEGTRNIKNTGFNPASIKAAYRSKATILPATNVNTSGILEKNGNRIKSDRTKIIYHKPIPYEEYKDITAKELSYKLEKIIYDAYEM